VGLVRQVFHPEKKKYGEAEQAEPVLLSLFF
jgi:hypothetical protein